MIPFEHDNLRAYQLFLRLEVALREITREVYQSSYGNGWQRKIPGALLKRVRESQSVEKAKKNFGLRRLGPLYYLTFGELLDILQQSPSKEHLATTVDSSFVNQLRNLTTPRNAICHSRPISPSSLATLEAVYDQLVTAYSQDTIEMFVKSPEVGVDPEEALPQLYKSICDAQVDIKNLTHPIDIPSVYEVARHQYWWGASDFAGFETSDIDSVMSLFIKYNSLPTGVGSAGIRNEFVRKHEMTGVVDRLAQCLKR